MSNQIFTLKFNKPGGKVVIAELPLSTWTIINTNTLSISGDTITQTGVGGWQEEMYKAFSVPTTGSYTITYDYDIESGYVGDWAYYGFGLFLSPNNPNVYDHYQFYVNSSNRVGTVIANPSTNIGGMKGTVSFTATLTGNTTYYLWYPGGALGDGTTYHLTFKNIDICNNPIQYLDGDAVPLRYTNRMLSYNYIEPPLVIDLNGQGRELTSEWYSQTKYPGVWAGLRIFSSGTAINGSYSPSGTYTTFIRNIGKLSSNFTLRYLPDCRNSTSYGYGRGTYLVDNTQLFYNTCPYGSGQDSNQPRYDKSRYYSVSVNVSKGGDIQMYFYTRATWYTNTLYYAIPEELVGKVINSI